MINGQTARFLITRNSLACAYKLVADQQTLSAAGLQIQGILTPGHTPGAMCYLVEGKYLFTGDTISLVDGQAGLFNNFYHMDTAREARSLEKISAFSGIQAVFTAHYGYSGDYPRAFAKWREQVK